MYDNQKNVQCKVKLVHCPSFKPFRPIFTYFTYFITFLLLYARTW